MAGMDGEAILFLLHALCMTACFPETRDEELSHAFAEGRKCYQWWLGWISFPTLGGLGTAFADV